MHTNRRELSAQIYNPHRHLDYQCVDTNTRIESGGTNNMKIVLTNKQLQIANILTYGKG